MILIEWICVFISLIFSIGIGMSIGYWLAKDEKKESLKDYAEKAQKTVKELEKENV